MSYNNYHNRDVGKLGEDLACRYIETMGYKVIDRNYRTRYGEIDIIASYKKEEIIFIEVKTRLSTLKGKGAENVGLKKIKKIMMVARKYAYERGMLNHKLRFDVIEIGQKSINHEEDEFKHCRRLFEINHIKNIMI